MKLATVLRLSLFVIALLALEICCRLKLISPFTMVAPSQFTLGLFNLVAGGTLNQEIAITLASITIAAVAAIVVGLGLGVTLYKLPRLRRALNPYLASYYAVPTFIFYPVLIVLFGFNRVPIIAIGFLHAFLTMTMSTLTGLDRMSNVLVKTSRVLGLTPVQAVWEITFPAALPYLLTGVKFAFAYSIVGVIGAEFILSSDGLGYQISYAFNNFDNTNLYGLIVLVVAVVVVVNSALFRIERQALIRRGLA